MIKAVETPYNVVQSWFEGLASENYISNFLKHKQKEDRGIFFEYNPVDKNVLFKELKKYNFSFPNELIHLWLELGGGDLFETYSILHPVHSELDWADDMITHNEYALSLGFDNEYFIFARDAGESAAFHKKNHKIVVFENQTFRKLKSYENITDWFQQMLYWHYNYVVITK